MKAIIFDWDGTLWDVTSFMVRTYSEVFRELDLPIWSKDDFRDKFGSDWEEEISGMGLSGHRDLLIRRWDEHILSESPRCFPWVHDLFERAGKNGPLAIVSSAPSDKLNLELKRNDLGGYLSAVLGADDVTAKKPSPKPLLECAKLIGVKPGDCSYVGDMVCDIDSAKAAGMSSIAVSWGLHSRERLSLKKPDFLADTPGNLMDFIMRNT